MDYVAMNMHCGQQNLLDKPSLLFAGPRHLIKQKLVMYYTRILTREEKDNELSAFPAQRKIMVVPILSAYGYTFLQVQVFLRTEYRARLVLYRNPLQK